MELVYFVALVGLLLIVLLHAGRFSLLYVLVDGIVFVLNDLLCLVLVCMLVCLILVCLRGCGYWLGFHTAFVFVWIGLRVGLVSGCCWLIVLRGMCGCLVICFVSG